MASKKTLDLNLLINPDSLAMQIGSMYQRWKGARSQWEKEKFEIRNYIFATDTTKTTNSSLPWKNTTTLPKLCQIRDNLHANYMAALFPHEDWFTWYAMDKDGATEEKRKAIMQYMKNKLVVSNFRNEVSKCIYDYIDFGNCFAEVIYVSEYHVNEQGMKEPVYIGPKLKRISPYDIVFDITAAEFKDAPKITRSLATLGQLKKMVEDQPQQAGWIKEAIPRAEKARFDYSANKSNGINYVSKGFIIDGFGSLDDYYTSGVVEILEFEGDLYDATAGQLYENHRIIVIDRMIVVYMAPYTSWLGRSNKEHVGWRLRPDSLLAMGPLDNLVGMQYRIDHLENLKADVFDQIAHPVVYQRGMVEDWEWGPGERIYGDSESDVKMLVPDSTALNADFQIDRIEQKMEEFAGAPRQAMGIRTPGEKTAYEVQTLENAAGRIFQNKVQYFEEVFLEPILNQYLAAARQSLDVADQIRVQDEDIGVVEFISISKDDLTAKGKLVPMGARHFARKAQLVQNITNWANSSIGADPSVKVHISGYKLAKMSEELLGLEKYEIVRKNVAISEQLETQQMTVEAQRILMQDQVTDPELEGVDQDQLSEVERIANGGT